MGKHKDRPEKRLKVRQDDYDRQSSTAQAGGKRPGSLNPKK